MQPTPADAGMRPFGHASDLDLDLRSADRAQLVTTLLAQCTGSGDTSVWWARSIGARIGALLRLVVLTEGCDEVELSGRCSTPACGARFEFALPLCQLAAERAHDEPIRVALGPMRTATFRRPTGEDLLRWRAAHPHSREAAVRAMLAALALESAVDIEDAPAVSAALAADDPLVDFAVACRCPACGAENEVSVDLEAMALRKLHVRQKRLLAEVHRLASHYGWSESEVLAVPAQRRARYLALIEEEQ